MTENIHYVKNKVIIFNNYFSNRNTPPVFRISGQTCRSRIQPSNQNVKYCVYPDVKGLVQDGKEMRNTCNKFTVKQYYIPYFTFLFFTLLSRDKKENTHIHKILDADLQL